MALTIMYSLRSSDENQIFLIEDDILDIKEYFNNHFNKHSFIVSKINDSLFWDKIGSIIEKIPSFYWKDVFGVLWGNNKNLNDKKQYMLHSTQF